MSSQREEERRLVFSPRTYLRALQMSRVPFFIFVEGPLDRAFVELLCSRSGIALPTRFEVRTSQELDAKSSGKSSLVKLYCALHHASGLVSELDGKKTSCLFVVDRDGLGDCGHIPVSTHLELTRDYSVENYLVDCGELVVAAVAATGISTADVGAVITPDWKRQRAEAWVDWVLFCVFCNRSRLRTSPTFRSPSLMHDPESGELDPVRRGRTLDGSSAEGRFGIRCALCED